MTRSAIEETAGKILFADQLRGIAALLVVVNHFTGIYWLDRATVAHHIFSPMQTGATPPLALAVIDVPFNPGPLGVALFFLISGFVIPFSFRHHSTISFLIARMLRIYPTYLVALAVGLTARIASAFYWNYPLQIRPAFVIANGMLIHDLLGIPSIDLVNWTLTIELKFYLMVALFFGMIMRWRAKFILAVGSIAVLFNLTVAPFIPHLSGWLHSAATSLGNEAMCVAFMLLGTLFHLNIRGLLSMAWLIASSAMGLGLFVACSALGTMADQFPAVTQNYIYAWAIFALCFFSRRWFISIAPLRFFAAISYPLYLVHSSVAFVIMAVMMMRYEMNYLWAASVAFTVVVLIAVGIHVLIERRGIAWGRALAVPRDARRQVISLSAKPGASR
jgi:peptidoglycan/LPS O-acetylase OafA/YrhL